MPAEATVPANTANWCCTVFNGSLLFDSRHAYELLLTNIAAMFLLGGVGIKKRIVLRKILLREKKLNITNRFCD